jgi:hypothetical protein
MDFEELRKLIRSSLALKIKEMTTKKSIIDNFSDFRADIALSLESSGVSQVLIDEILENDESVLFESVYDAWKNIAFELQLVSRSARRDVWNEAVAYYVSKAIVEVLSNTPHEDSSKEISDKVVLKMTR